MEKIILFGAGKRLESVIRIIEKLKSFRVVEVWDNDVNKIGKSFRIGEDEVVVIQPHSVFDIPVVINSTIHRHELREQLRKEFNSKQEYIKDPDYLFHYLKEEIIIKYKDREDIEIQEIITYLKRHELSVFNYMFCNEYANADINLTYDGTSDLYYTEWKGHKMFLPKSLGNEENIKAYIKNILIEQDKRSPHCYDSFDLNISSRDILVDAGAAEGFFTLERIEKVKKAYLIENDPEWIRALNMTFSQYEDKVSIINRALGDHCDNETITLDSINKEDRITMIKMDIEGAELSALGGANLTLNNSRIEIISCTYHRSNDAGEINSVLQKHGFQTSFSRGYMFFPYGVEDQIKSELRRGLICGKKQEGALY